VSGRTLVLYGRPNCLLCEEALDAARRAAPCGVEVRYTDITTDEVLERRYRHRIPVAVLDGVEIAEGRPDTVAAAIRASLSEPD
jgi:hypothetical protein